MNFPVRNVILPCLTITVFMFGLGYVIVQSLFSVLPFGVIFALSLIFAVYTLRMPCLDLAAVEAIIGKDPWDEPGMINSTKTIAHRGAGMDAPENSLAAFQMCNDKGCKTIEFDVALTEDGVPIVFHDYTLDRMAGREGIINKMKWVDLKSVDISVNHAFKERFVNTHIPTLDESIKQLLKSGQQMFIDIKDTNMQMIKVITDLYDSYPELYLKAAVTSIYPYIIYNIRRRNPNIVCTIAWRPYMLSTDSFDIMTGPGRPRSTKWYIHYLLSVCDIINEWLLSRITYYILGISFILLHKSAVCGQSVVEWRKKGVRVIAWPVNTPAEKQYHSKYLKVTYLTDTLIGESPSNLTLS